MNQKLVFIGTKPLGLRALEAITRVAGDQLRGVVTADDTKDERSNLDDYRAYCEKRGIPLRVLTKPGELAAVLAEWKPEVGIVSGWYWLISDDVLASVPRGLFGIHGSLLPAGRGNAPLVWAILRGERESGLSLFRFESGIDTGAIAGEWTFAIGPDDTIADVLALAEKGTVELVEKHLVALCDGTASLREQNHADATYYGVRRADDGEIDWTRPATEIHDLVRATTRPYPGAFTHLPSGEKVMIWRARPFARPMFGVPGRVAQREPDGWLVGCEAGSGLVILEAELADASGSDPLKYAMKLGARGPRSQ